MSEQSKINSSVDALGLASQTISLLSAEIKRSRASQERLKSAIEFAHAEGFQWPSDPMAEFAQPEPAK